MDEQLLLGLGRVPCLASSARPCSPKFWQLRNYVSEKLNWNEIHYRLTALLVHFRSWLSECGHAICWLKLKLKFSSPCSNHFRKYLHFHFQKWIRVLILIVSEQDCEFTPHFLAQLCRSWLTLCAHSMIPFQSHYLSLVYRHCWRGFLRWDVYMSSHCWILLNNQPST